MSDGGPRVKRHSIRRVVAYALDPVRFAVGIVLAMLIASIRYHSSIAAVFEVLAGWVLGGFLLSGLQEVHWHATHPKDGAGLE